jgi:hypothetical protein
MRLFFVFSILLGLCFLFSLKSVAAQEQPDTPNVEESETLYQLQEGELYTLRGDQKTRIGLPGPGFSLKRVDNRLYVALGERGAAVLEIDEAEDLSVSHLIPVSHGRVTGFLVEGERLWMQVDSSTAVLISGQSSSTAWTGGEVAVRAEPMPQAAPSQSMENPVEAQQSESEKKLGNVHIIETYPGKVKLDMGLSDGIEVGDRFAVFRTEKVARTGDEQFEGEVLVAIIVVQAVNESTALARIWRGDRISKGDVLSSADKKDKASLAYPRHLTGLFEIDIAVRPIINVGSEGGFGALCDLSFSWWGRYVFANVRMQPLGFGWVDDGQVVTSSLLAEGGYNGRAFALGIGLGIAAVNGDMDNMLGYGSDLATSKDSSGSEEEPTWEQRTQVGFALSQRVRLGARDGFNVTVSNVLIYHEDNSDEEDARAGFIYGGTNGRISWPLALRVDMFLDGGGGVMGYWYGALGIFTWVRGNGDAGSVGISASAGGAGLSGQRAKTESRTDYQTKETNTYTDTERLSIAGPMFSLGLTIRLGKTI